MKTKLKPLTDAQRKLVESKIQDIAVKLAREFASRQSQVPYEDLLSIALESLCLAAQKDPPPGNYGSHAYMTARCDLLNAIEKHNNHAKYIQNDERELDDALSPEDVAFGQAPQATPTDTLAYYSECLERLSTDDRKLVGLLVDGNTQEQVGEMFDVSRHAIASRVRAIKDMFI